MSTQLFEITSAHPCLSTSTEIASITKPLEVLGINYFTFTRIDRSGKRIYLTNQPAVLESYCNGKHYLTGNLEGYPDYYSPQIILWESLPNQKIFDDVVRSYNFNHGMFMIEPHEDHCDFFGIATDNWNRSIINTYLTKLDYIKNFMEYFTEKSNDLIKLVADKEIILPFNKDITVIDFTANNFIKDHVLITNSNTKIKFTPRQFEIAHILIKGKGIKDIAKELKLSPRTIETHVNLLKSKLKCHRLTELTLKLSKIMV